MHDIWNPWHGCKKISEGCQHCYMYYLDKTRGKDGGEIYKTKNGFDYPLQKDRHGRYKIQSGELIRVCMTSDFFLEEADPWRAEAWDIMWQRRDVKFFILTKRPERVRHHLPADWGDGWENIFFHVSCENQKRADERIPLLLELPFKHKGIMCAPLIGPVSIDKYLNRTGHISGIEQVIAGGENYDGARPCDYQWIRLLRRQCEAAGISFTFIETGTRFVKDGKIYLLKGKQLQSRMAWKSGASFQGRPILFQLCDPLGFPVPEEQLYQPAYRPICQQCGSKPICNGCSHCGLCESRR